MACTQPLVQSLMEDMPYTHSFPLSTPTEYDEALFVQPSFGPSSFQASDDSILPMATHDALLHCEHVDTSAYLNLSEEHHGDEAFAGGTLTSLQHGYLPLACEIVPQECQQDENEVISRGRDDFRWKEIQEELMEENSLTDLLLTCDEAVEAENWHLASGAIARIDHLLLFDQEKETNSFHRLAYYFTRGLHSRTIASDHRHESIVHPTATNDMSAFQMLQELSPYVKFAHFTANQAILEATEGDRDVHIIDFDVMEGFQWPPLMVDLSQRKDTSLWITVIAEEGNVSGVHRTGRRLLEFAESIGLPLRFDHIMLENGGDMEGIETSHGSVVVNCMIHQLQTPSGSFITLKAFLGAVRRLTPKMVVMVEEELFTFNRGTSMSFLEFFCDAMHHFSALSDSLLRSFYGGYEMGLRLVERELLGPRIIDCVGQFNRERRAWDCAASSLEGFRAIPLSSYNVSQAKLLVGLFGRGFGVQHEKGRLALCWNSRPLSTLSVWVPESTHVGKRGRRAFPS